MSRRREKKKKSSLLGKAAKFGLVYGAFKLLRSDAVRSSVSGVMGGVTNRVRKGAPDATASTDTSF